MEKWRTWVRSPSVLSKSQLHCSIGAVFFLLPEVRTESKIIDCLVAQKLLLKSPSGRLELRSLCCVSLFALSNHNPNLSVLVWRLLGTRDSQKVLLVPLPALALYFLSAFQVFHGHSRLPEAVCAVFNCLKSHESPIICGRSAFWKIFAWNLTFCCFLSA